MNPDQAARAHPYMANSTDEARRRMLDAVGVADVEELFIQIPAEHRLDSAVALGPALRSEVELRRHLTDVLGRNQNCEQNLSFLGAGCWQHYVPAVCDEIAGRAEFLTPVWGTPSSDQGRSQAWFEYASQLGELVGMDFVGLPVYSWGCAAGHAIRMAARMTGRDQVLLPRAMDPERLAVVRTYCGTADLTGHLEIVLVDHDPATGRTDLDDLRGKLSSRTAAVCLDTPTYLGVVESDAAEIVGIARSAGAETIVGVDPISLGVLAPPGQYGADIVVGTTQPLGIHMNCGGGVGGFIATRDEERYAREYPTLQVSICDTMVPGEKGFGNILFEQSSYGAREDGKDWTGNSVYLWAVVNAVYMSLLGPQGFAELGATILSRSHYTAQRLARIPGVEVVWPGGFFKEFVVRFESVSVADVNTALRQRGIFGGKDLTEDLPELGGCALFCVTERHTVPDIDRLVDALTKVVNP